MMTLMLFTTITMQSNAEIGGENATVVKSYEEWYTVNEYGQDIGCPTIMNKKYTTIYYMLGYDYEEEREVIYYRHGIRKYKVTRNYTTY